MTLYTFNGEKAAEITFKDYPAIMEVEVTDNGKVEIREYGPAGKRQQLSIPTENYVEFMRDLLNIQMYWLNQGYISMPPDEEEEEEGDDDGGGDGDQPA